MLEVGVLITKNQELTAKLETLLKNHEKERDDWKKKEVELNNTVRKHIFLQKLVRCTVYLVILL